MKDKGVRLILILGCTILVAITVIGVFWLPGFLEVDRCLDYGGRWSPAYNICEH